jgi:HEAT repeat protein
MSNVEPEPSSNDMTAKTASRIFAAAVLATVLAGIGIAYVQRSKTVESPFSGPASTTFPTFRDRTPDFGLTTGHRQGDERLTGLDETLGAGVCAFDYDNDGWVDLFIVNGSGDTRYYGRRHWWESAGGHHLLRNENGKRFVDVTKQAGIDAVTNGMGCVAADFDNDGHTDLLITNVGANLLLRNNGDGTFSDVSKASGLGGEAWHTAAAVADVDGDGLLDIYVGGLIDFKKGARTFEPGSQFRQDASPFFNSALYPALPNHLYRNLGGFRFEDVTEAAGVADSDGRTLAALWVDVNDDGKPDLIVANATGTGSTTGFMNRGNWHFERMGLQARIDSGLSFRGIAMGDLNNDGRAELVLTGASGNQTALLFRSANASEEGVAFVDEARQWRVATEQYAAFSPWSPLLGDFNNDGWTDLFVVNGQLTPDPDSPHVTEGQPKQLWLNGGDSQLHAYHPPPMSPLLDHQSARGAVVADFNNDGKLDLYVVHNNDLGQLLINETESPNHWLGVKLIDSHGNSDAVGARVSSTTEQGTQVRWLTKGSGFLSDGDPRLHFGLGSATHTTLSVTWRDGSHDVYRDVPADTYVVVSRANGLARAPAHQAPAAGLDNLPKQNPEVRAEFYKALAGVDETIAVEDTLREAIHDPDQQVRSALIDALSQKKGAGGLRVLLGFLDDADDANAARAVDAVCAYEEEFATRFLLRMFAHRAAAVRQHTADCFTRYYEGFQAQQAVIHRKYLAVPYLAGLLADADSRVRISTARALGAAERFRGVPPLIESLADEDVAVRQEAVRSLGLIRDKYALPALEQLMTAPDIGPETYAQLFIAQKRLDEGGLDSLLADFSNARTPFANVAPTTRLATFLAILESNDGIVFSRESIANLAASTYAHAKHTDPINLLYARIVEKSGARGSVEVLTPFLASNNPRVRLAGYLADFTLQPGNQINSVRAALADPDSSVRIGILQRVAADNVALPDTLFVEALGKQDTRLAGINALRSVGSDSVRSMLVGWAADADANTAVRIAALAALSRAKCAAAFPKGWDRDAHDDLLVAMLEFEAAQLPSIFVSKGAPAFLGRYARSKSPAVRRAVVDFLFSREELWAKQAVVDLLQSTDDPALRHYVLQSTPPSYLFGGSVFLNIAGNPADPLRYEALRHLRGVGDEQTVKALRGIADNPAEDALARVLAAAALPASSGAATLTMLLNR